MLNVDACGERIKTAKENVGRYVPTVTFLILKSLLNVRIHLMVGHRPPWMVFESPAFTEMWTLKCASLIISGVPLASSSH